jgi:hypothetical protein
LATENKIDEIDFARNLKQAAALLEQRLFADEASGKIGMIVLKDGPGTYAFDPQFISYWAVDNSELAGRTIFGVEFGSFIIFDVVHRGEIVRHFDIVELQKAGEKQYFAALNAKISKKGEAILWNQSMVGIGDGWHEIPQQAFTRCQ